jgi:hypothetical protein
VAYAGEYSPTSAGAPTSRVPRWCLRSCPLGKNPVHLKGNPDRGERRGFRSGRSTGLGECVTVLSMEQPTPDGLGSGLNRIKEWLDPNCRANGWAMKKAALDQQASDAARRLFPSEGLDLGDVRTKPISIVGTERQQTVHSRVSGDIVRKTFRPGGFTAMAASSGFLIAEVERHFPVLRLHRPRWRQRGRVRSRLSPRKIRAHQTPRRAIRRCRCRRGSKGAGNGEGSLDLKIKAPSGRSG